MRQAVEADVARLRKILDDTNVIRLNLETEIESLKEELISLRKNHERVCIIICIKMTVFDNHNTEQCTLISNCSGSDSLFHFQKDVAELQAHIAQAGVHVDVDAPKGQDLNRIMEEIRAKYEKIALKNQEELKAWHDTQVQPNAAAFWILC